MVWSIQRIEAVPPDAPIHIECGDGEQECKVTLSNDGGATNTVVTTCLRTDPGHLCDDLRQFNVSFTGDHDWDTECPPI
jgi:hypothetical protein